MLVDVMVVGAGLSGLYAARQLVRAGLSVVVLEARDRVGGRTLSRRIGDGTFDLGGQWIGPGQTRLRALVDELGIETFPTWTGGRKALDLGGRIRTYRGAIPRLSVIDLVAMQLALARLSLRARTVDPARPERAARWDGRTVDSLEADILRRPVWELFAGAVRVVFGAEPAELSLLHFLFYLRAAGGFRRLIDVAGGAQEARFAGGAQGLSLRLAAELGDRVVLSAPVDSIEDRSGRVIAESGGRIWRARRAIVAVPPPLAARIHWSPGLPADSAALLGGFAMGATVKCIATYPRPFWREAGWSGEAFAPGAPISVVFDDTSHEGQPALLGFVVGEAARRWKDTADRRGAALAGFARFFGEAARHPTEVAEMDWTGEVWTGGCPVGATRAGVFGRHGAAWRRPVGAIHWAGTEHATRWNGYLEGALEAADRAVGEVVAGLSGTTRTRAEREPRA